MILSQCDSGAKPLLQRWSNVMTSFRNVELPAPKRGGKHLLLGVCRISNELQNEMSLSDQMAFYHDWAKKEYPDGYEMDKISSRDSGEALDRAEFLDLTE